MRLHNIKKTYHNQKNTVTALNGISLNLDTNGIIMILGPSGCGKTTLMNIIAGRTDYEGSITDVPAYDYLPQDFNLFEDMSVMDNLLTVNSNHDLIEEYLKEFSLSEHKNKKVKKLSNGQKKRVQFIRALLHSPSMLLCDEPTAALDHDNTVLLMEEMKKLSDQMQIIIVTHDTALAEQYGDRIITMEKGTVVKDETVHHKEECSKGTSLPKRSMKENAVLGLKKTFASIPSTVLQTVLCTVIMLSMTVFVNMTGNVSEQSSYAETFRNGKNLIVSLPQHTTKKSNENYSGYSLKYTDRTMEDWFDYADIEKVIEDHPEIIAVESFNSPQYETGLEEDMFLQYEKHEEYDSLAFNAFEKETGTDYDTFVETPIIVPENLLDYDRFDDAYSAYTDLLSTNRVQVFDLVNGYEDLPLACGSYPQKDEILLDRNTADLVKEVYGYDSYEDMIGREIILGPYYRSTMFSSDQEDGFPIGLIRVTVSGVSSVENDSMRMVFFNEGFGNNPVYQEAVKDKSHLKTDYVRFLVEPGCDYEAVAESIDMYFHKPNTDITVYKGLGLGNTHKVYESAEGLLVYGGIITAVLLFLCVLARAGERKKLCKEKNIMHIYGYSPLKICIISNIVICLLALILTVICTIPLSTLINDFASSHYYQPFMTPDIGIILAVAVLTCVFMIVVETAVSARGKHE